LVVAAVQEAAKNKLAHDKRMDQRFQKEAYIAGIRLKLDQGKIMKLKGAELNDQIKVYRQAFANEKSFPSTGKLKVAEKRVLVLEMALKCAQIHQDIPASS
jgi:hypothetical protein